MFDKSNATFDINGVVDKTALKQAIAQLLATVEKPSININGLVDMLNVRHACWHHLPDCWQLQLTCKCLCLACMDMPRMLCQTQNLLGLYNHLLNQQANGITRKCLLLPVKMSSLLQARKNGTSDLSALISNLTQKKDIKADLVGLLNSLKQEKTIDITLPTIPKV